MTTDNSLLMKLDGRSRTRAGERGAALIMALMMLALMGAIAMTVLALVRTEVRIAGSDLRRTQTCYAAAAGIEKMTSDFSQLYAKRSYPTSAQLTNIANTPPTELTGEGFTFYPAQTIAEDTINLGIMRTAQGLNSTTYPSVTLSSGPFGGLTASIDPFTLTTTATATDGSQCSLTRTMNNYLIPIFQFGMFSDEDIELHPGPAFYFNGRIHANGNIYANGNVTFLSKVTTANEFIYDVRRNGTVKDSLTSVHMTVSGINVPITMGSMMASPPSTTVLGGPKIATATTGQRGYFPDSPEGIVNSNWNTTSVAAPVTAVANKLGGQLQTRSTGAVPLKLPLQLDGNPTREIIKRRMPNDSVTLSSARYHTTASIRILIDDEVPSLTDASGIPAGSGVTLSSFDPIPLPNVAINTSPTANGGGRALWRIKDDNTGISNSYDESATSWVLQQQNLWPLPTTPQADTVRSVRVEPTTAKAISAASNATPIRITTTAAHGFTTGDIVSISGVAGNAPANGKFVITVTSTTRFTLNSTAGVASGTGGTVIKIPSSANGTVIPSGAGITGRILIQIVDSNGATYDVTQQILSMGMTEGEPNAIVMLQRPLWAAFTQGTRDASTTNTTVNATSGLTGDSAYANHLVDITTKTHIGAAGQIRGDNASGYPTLDTTNGYLKKLKWEAGQPVRSEIPPGVNVADWGTGATPQTSFVDGEEWNAIVPINVYNVREGLINSTMPQNAVYERGITSIVELNMKNLARWMDGVFDQNLLAGTNAVSSKIAKPDGYTVYVSDRRGDRVRTMTDSSNATIDSSNGMVDNEDIYGPNSTLDKGEDVQGKGALVHKVEELADTITAMTGTGGADAATRNKRALTVALWSNKIGGVGTDANNHNFFRSALRLFNGANLQTTGATDKLNTMRGITVATENMVYIWGSYNTSGITGQPTNASTLNDGSYLGVQVPTSIVSDAFFPLSRTWFDAEPAVYPEDLSKRLADLNLSALTNPENFETSVRAAIIAGNNLSAMAASPDAGNSSNSESRLNGGMHNFPRFLENWNDAAGADQRWNFVGSLIPLYHSTQAMGQYNANSAIYNPPLRNWAFDTTFQIPTKLPPGTPMFQYIEPTAFRQIL